MSEVSMETIEIKCSIRAVLVGIGLGRGIWEWRLGRRRGTVAMLYRCKEGGTKRPLLSMASSPQLSRSSLMALHKRPSRKTLARTRRIRASINNTRATDLPSTTTIQWEASNRAHTFSEN